MNINSIVRAARRQHGDSVGCAFQKVLEKYRTELSEEQLVRAGIRALDAKIKQFARAEFLEKEICRRIRSKSALPPPVEFHRPDLDGPGLYVMYGEVYVENSVAKTFSARYIASGQAAVENMKP